MKCRQLVIQANLPTIFADLVDPKRQIAYTNSTVNFNHQELEMKERELDTKSAGYYAYAAAIDARMKAIAGWSKYSEKQKVEAERVKQVMSLVYNFKGIYANPRDKFIAIKLENPTVKDRKNLKLLEKDWEAKGYTKTSTEQGITYRIPKV